jgi:hypothetical protein
MDTEKKLGMVWGLRVFLAGGILAGLIMPPLTRFVLAHEDEVTSFEMFIYIVISSCVLIPGLVFIARKLPAWILVVLGVLGYIWLYIQEIVLVK